MGFFNRLARVIARESAREHSKTPEQRFTDKLGKEMGENLEFVETMTQEQYDEWIRKEKEGTDRLFEKVDEECKLICDKVYDLFNDYQDGLIPRLQLFEAIDKAREELKRCVNLAMDRNGHNLSVIESTIVPAKE